MFDKKKLAALSPFCMLSKNSVLKWEEWNEDSLQFLNYYTYFSSIALSQFRWVFPDDVEYPLISSDMIEKLLYYLGTSAIVDDSDRGYIICRYSPVKGYYNFFGEPSQIEAFDMFTEKPLGRYDSDHFVIINNNIMRYPSNLIVMEKCFRLSNINDAIDINIDGQKIPVVFQGTPEQKSTLKTVMEKYKTGERPLFLNKDFNINDVTALNPGVPFMAEQLFKTADTVKGELLTMLGIDNVNISKESGVTDDEVNANNQIVQLSYDMMKDSRLKAIDDIKQKFGIEIKLNARPDSGLFTMTEKDPESTEGGEDE